MREEEDEEDEDATGTESRQTGGNKDGGEEVTVEVRGEIMSFGAAKRAAQRERE